jgi:hypothetical protein
MKKESTKSNKQKGTENKHKNKQAKATNKQTHTYCCSISSNHKKAFGLSGGNSNCEGRG